MFILMPPIRPVFSPFQRSFNYVYSPYSPNPSAIYINEPCYGSYYGSAFRNFGFAQNPYFNYGFNPLANPFFAQQNFLNSTFLRNQLFLNSFSSPFAYRNAFPFYRSPQLSYRQAFGPGFFVGSPYTRSPVGYYGVGPGLTNFDYHGVYSGRYTNPFFNPFLFNNFGPLSLAPNLNFGPNWVAANIMNNRINGINFNPVNPGVIASA